MLIPERFRGHPPGTPARKRYFANQRVRPMGAGLQLSRAAARGRDRVPGRDQPQPVRPGPAAADATTIAIVRDIAERLESERLPARRPEASLQLLQDRVRIARDLHDLVIQRLFAAGMALQGDRGPSRGTPTSPSRIAGASRRPRRHDPPAPVGHLRVVGTGSTGGPSLRREVLGNGGRPPGPRWASNPRRHPSTAPSTPSATCSPSSCCRRCRGRH